jgi:hypothetical protein
MDTSKKFSVKIYAEDKLFRMYREVNLNQAVDVVRKLNVLETSLSKHVSAGITPAELPLVDDFCFSATNKKRKYSLIIPEYLKVKLEELTNRKN